MTIPLLQGLLGVQAETLQQRLMRFERQRQQANECYRCGATPIKVLTRLECGEWVDVGVCPEHEEEFVKEGGWR
jgi:hypothetical protein